MDIENHIIDEDAPVLEALERLNNVSGSTLYITQHGALKASLTDGDVRRWILSRGSLDAPLSKAANYNPLFLKNANKTEALKYLKTKGIESIPILDNDNHITRIVTKYEQELINTGRALSIPVVIMAGGRGARLSPYTNVLPKPLIPIGDIPVTEHIINQFLQYGIKTFHLIVNYKKNMIKSYFNDIDRDYEIIYTDEDAPLGTGGGLSLLKGTLDTPFILTNCDILIDHDFYEIYKHHVDKGNFITIVSAVKNVSIPYGVLDINADGSLSRLNEKPRHSLLVNTGCYIVEPAVADSLKEGEFINFTDIITRHMANGKKIGVYPIPEGAWMDMGHPDAMENMRERLCPDDGCYRD